jgi:hypothetical protein
MSPKLKDGPANHSCAARWASAMASAPPMARWASSIAFWLRASAGRRTVFMKIGVTAPPIMFCCQSIHCSAAARATQSAGCRRPAP